MIDFHAISSMNTDPQQLSLPFCKSEKEELQDRLINGMQALANLIEPSGESKERAKQASSLCYELHTNFFRLAQILPSDSQKASLKKDV